MMPTRDLAYYLALKYPISVQEREGGRYFVTHPDLDGCMAEGDSLTEAVANLADARELWIETRLSNGYPVPESMAAEETFSGRISLRMDPELHARLAMISERKAISLNLLVNTVLAAFTGGEDPLHETLREVKDYLRQVKTLPVAVAHSLKKAG